MGILFILAGLGITGFALYSWASSKQGGISAALQFNRPGTLSVRANTDPHVQALIDYYSPSRGQLSSWWQRIKSEGRNKLLMVLNEEQIRVIEQGAILENSILQGRKNQSDLQVFIAQNAATLYQIKADANLIDQALAKGRTVATDQEIIRAGGLSQVKVDEEGALSDIRVREHKRKKVIDLEGRWQEITQDSDAADLAQIGDYLVVKKLRQELREAREERYAIKASNRPDELKRELLADYNKFITRLEGKIDERETGRVLPENRQAPRGLKEGASNRRANYPPETDADFD